MFISKKLRTLLNEVVYVERINEKFAIEVKILRKQHEFPFKKNYSFML